MMRFRNKINIPRGCELYPAIPQLFSTLGYTIKLKRNRTMLQPPFNLDCKQRYNYTTSTTNAVNSGSEKRQIEPGIFTRVLKKVGLTSSLKTNLKVASHILYESAADNIHYLNFFRDFNMPNTFNSWFLVTELHIWMLLVRAMAEGAEAGDDGRLLRNCIVEVMWSDVNVRAKKLGASNPSRTRKQIEILSEQFQAALIAYDEGIMTDDRILAAALWRRFFEMNCNDYQQIERMVKYVREQVDLLDNLARDDFLTKSKIPWMQLKKLNI